MSISKPNKWGSQILNLIYSYQNSTENIAFSSLALSVIVTAVNFGLDAKCYKERNKFWKEDLKDIYTSNPWKNQNIASISISRRNILEDVLKMNSALFFSGFTLEAYCKMFKSIFNLEHKNVNIRNLTGSALVMNTWVSNRMHGSTTNIFNESNLGDRIMVYINTLYVRAAWKLNFNPGLTKPEIFYDDRGMLSNVSMMNQESIFDIYDSPSDFFSILFKNFTNPDIYSAIVLPRDDHTLEDVIEYLNFDRIYSYFDKAVMKYIKLKLPKFSMVSQNDFMVIRKKSGKECLTHLIYEDVKKIVKDPEIVCNISQVVNLEINEIGTDAGSATEVTVEKSLNQPQEFYVNRSFLFLIYSHSTRFVLFSAAVTNPSAS
ncbi:Glia-derived nexin [Thelohanellus kitauei]|uniref:Glia-derived nexin n=1 Tax=Thelohanellus kitauei TaxID=669202 RepID=A0A0C2MHX2_THEKT|nr:Glia-derived nexin [Thelohanellus kitauei]